jgi:glycyl-tRNA synthetase alpha subunit
MHTYLPRPQSLSKGGEENEKKFFVGRAKISHHALPGNDITATDLYRLQLHCTVPNEGPAEEAAHLLNLLDCTQNISLKSRRTMYILVPRAIFTRSLVEN